MSGKKPGGAKKASSNHGLGRPLPVASHKERATQSQPVQTPTNRKRKREGEDEPAPTPSKSSLAKAAAKAKPAMKQLANRNTSPNISDGEEEEDLLSPQLWPAPKRRKGSETPAEAPTKVSRAVKAKPPPPALASLPALPKVKAPKKTPPMTQKAAESSSTKVSPSSRQSPRVPIEIPDQEEDEDQMDVEPGQNKVSATQSRKTTTPPKAKATTTATAVPRKNFPLAKSPSALKANAQQSELKQEPKQAKPPLVRKSSRTKAPAPPPPVEEHKSDEENTQEFEPPTEAFETQGGHADEEDEDFVVADLGSDEELDASNESALQFDEEELKSQSFHRSESEDDEEELGDFELGDLGDEDLAAAGTPHDSSNGDGNGEATVDGNSDAGEGEDFVLSGSEDVFDAEPNRAAEAEAPAALPTDEEEEFVFNDDGNGNGEDVDSAAGTLTVEETPQGEEEEDFEAILIDDDVDLSFPADAFVPVKPEQPSEEAPTLAEAEDFAVSSSPVAAPSSQTRTRSSASVAAVAAVDVEAADEDLNPEEFERKFAVINEECEQFLSKTKLLRKKLEEFFDSVPGKFRTHWQTEWRQSMKDIAKKVKAKNDITIAVVGDTGAGKSTLANAILRQRLLPSNAAQACTAAITEITFSEGTSYEAEVFAMNLKEWKQEKKRLQAEIDQKGPQFQQANDICMALFGVPKVQGDLPKAVQLLVKKEREIFSADDPEELMKLVEPYIDSSVRPQPTTSAKSKRAQQVQFWPVVKKVSISGPFAALSGGVTLVDLPGANDNNKAREEVSKKYLSNADCLWVAAPIRRAASNNTVSVLAEEALGKHFGLNVVMSGLITNLCIIATCADDINISEVKRNLLLHDELSEVEVAKERNEAAKRLIRNHLVVDMEQLIQQAIDSTTDDEVKRVDLEGDGAERLRLAARETPVFTVSALDYLRLKRLEESTKRQLFNKFKDTEVPQLQQYLMQTSYTVKISIYETARTNLKQLLQHMETHLEGVPSASQDPGSGATSQDSAAELAQQRLRAHFTELFPFLRNSVKSASAALSQKLTQRRAERLDGRLDAALAQIPAKFDSVITSWQTIQWNSFKAACRGLGTHKTPKAAMDLNTDVCQPFLSAIALGWSEFFTALQEVVQASADTVCSALDKLHQDVLARMHVDQELAAVGSSGHFDTQIKSMRDNLHGLFRTQINDIATKLTDEAKHAQKTGFANLNSVVRASLTVAYKEAASTTGKGVMERMLSIIRVGFNREKDTMMKNMHTFVKEQLDTVTTKIVSEFEKAVTTQGFGMVERDYGLLFGAQAQPGQQPAPPPLHVTRNSIKAQHQRQPSLSKADLERFKQILKNAKV